MEDLAARRRRVLVDVDWLADHLHDPFLVLLEVDDRPALYHRGHAPGARLVDWRATCRIRSVVIFPGRRP